MRCASVFPPLAVLPQHGSSDEAGGTGGRRQATARCKAVHERGVRAARRLTQDSAHGGARVAAQRFLGQQPGHPRPRVGNPGQQGEGGP